MPTVLTESIVKPPVLTTPTVKSAWAKTPPITAGNFSAALWADAGTMQIPEGVLMVKNDHQFLYVLLDLVKDTGASPGVGDYFWLSFDVDGNASITPNRDVNYGIYPDPPIRIGKQFYLGPGTWTGISNQPTQSLAKQEFGPSPQSKVPHRIWELRVDLKEVGANLVHFVVPPVVHFGLRISSTTPQFTADFPPDFFENFAHLPGILLATTAPLPSLGKPVAGVGIIPVGDGKPGSDGINPTTGRATTASNYYLPTKDAAFGGALNFIGDQATLQKLWNQNAKKYHVKMKTTQQVLFQSWTNYHFKNNQWTYEYFAPDAEGCYQLTVPTDTYSIDHLLFQWNTTGLATGTYDLEIEFMNAVGTVVSSQALRLMIDNNLPDVRILEVNYKGQTVAPCDIVTIDTGNDPVKVHFRAYDVEGDVYCYGLNAYHGQNKVDALVPTTYPIDGHGVADMWLSAPVNPKFPSETCAYEFRLWAYAKVVNGYSYLGYTEDSTHVTFQCPTATPYKMITKMTFPLGLTSADGKTGKPTQ